MPILVSSDTGCRVFSRTHELERELPGRSIGAITSTAQGVCFAIVDEQQIWRRDLHGQWSLVASCAFGLQSLVSQGDSLVAGGMKEATLLRILADGRAERILAFDNVLGRETWFAGGPPLGIRSLATTADGSALLAGVHVGGIPRSVDGGISWTPTLPVAFDVHQVCSHAAHANIVAAAAAVGLCISEDSGAHWRVLVPPAGPPYSLAVAAIEDDVLFSTQEGPFADRSQVWRWSIGSDRLDVVVDGLPEWLEGRIDTNQIATGCGRAAIVDCGGNLWATESGSRGWRRLAVGLGYVYGVTIVESPCD